MNEPDMFVTTAIGTVGPPEASVTLAAAPPQISAREAEELLEIQAALVKRGERANMNQVRARAAHEADFAAVARNASAVALLLAASDLRRVDSCLPVNSDYIEANLKSYAHTEDLDTRDMLAFEPYWRPARGTAFLTDEYTLVTARHVFNDNAALCALRHGKLRAVFGYEFSGNSRPIDVFARHRQLFDVEAIDPFPHPGAIPPGDDWIKLRLTESATRNARRYPLTVSTEPPATTTRVYTLGHPNGVTMRYVSTALPLEVNSGNFRAFVDAYENSSGTPVFSADSHSVIGMVTASSQPSGLVKVEGEHRRISQLCLPEYAEQATLCIRSAAFS
jgi:hypothetical protein